MKTLLILRHAKSSWADSGVADYDRPLNKRGMKAAPRVGRMLVEENLTPNCIVSSTALRAKQTTELVVEASEFESNLVWNDDFYLAPPQTYLNYLAENCDDEESVMVVGHNPGLESLLVVTTGQRRALPTAALAVVNLPIDSWSQLGAKTAGKLDGLYFARDL